MNSLIPSCWFVPILLVIFGLILIAVGLIVYFRSKRTYRGGGPLEHEFNLEISKNTFRYQGTVGGLLIAGGVVIALLAIYFLATSDCDKQQNTASVNLNSNTNIHITLIQLRDKLDRGVNEPQYEIRPYPNNEVVKEKPGKHYLIDLKDADSQVLILFRIGEYTRDEFQRVFIDAMSKVKQDVLNQLDAGKVSYRIYVRGSADILGDSKPSIGRLIEGDSREITFLVQNPNNRNQYLQETRTQVVPKEFANKHLPNLRAAYVQDKLRVLDLSSTILDGLVTPIVNEQDRNALILLYWP